MAPLRFGSYLIDEDRGALFHKNERVAIQAQPVRVLAMLVERRGELVTREEIRQRIWPSTTVAFDQSINYCIRQIRIALGPSAGWLETVPRQGYRFTVMTAAADDPRHRARAIAVAAVAAAVAVLFASGFGAGVLARNAPVGQFVYDHLVHPDHCPYMRFLFTTHRAS